MTDQVLSPIRTLTAQEFDGAVAQETPTLVEFYAEWCAPCRAMMPVLERFAEEANGRYHVCRISIDEERELAKRFDVRGVPTFLAFSSGKVIGRHGGTAGIAKLRSLMDV